MLMPSIFGENLFDELELCEEHSQCNEDRYQGK